MLQNSFLIFSYHKYMRKKTLKRHYKRHRKSCKRTYRKHRKSRTEKGLQLFTKPKKIHFESVLVNKNDFQSGNMIPGLRNM